MSSRWRVTASTMRRPSRLPTSASPWGLARMSPSKVPASPCWGRPHRHRPGAPAQPRHHAQHPPEPLLRLHLQCRGGAGRCWRALPDVRDPAVAHHRGGSRGPLVGQRHWQRAPTAGRASVMGDTWTERRHSDVGRRRSLSRRRATAAGTAHAGQGQEKEKDETKDGLKP